MYDYFVCVSEDECVIVWVVVVEDYVVGLGCERYDWIWKCLVKYLGSEV